MFLQKLYNIQCLYPPHFIFLTESHHIYFHGNEMILFILGLKWILLMNEKMGVTFLYCLITDTLASSFISLQFPFIIASLPIK